MIVNVTMGQPRISGVGNHQATPSGATGGDCSFVVTNSANVGTVGAFLQAAATAAQQMKAAGILK